MDSISYYTSNLEVYTGVQPDGPFRVVNSAISVTKRLVLPILKTGRNVTMDNWFTSIPLAEDIMLNNKLTIIGTLKKNKREVPPSFVCNKNRPVFGSYFGFQKNKTLVCYKANKKKTVLLLSTMHSGKIIDETTAEKKKPEIITAYNCTKGGVDTMDFMSENYSVARASAR